MKKLKKAVVVLLLAVALLAVAVAGIVIRAIRKPFPQTDGNINVSGLNAEVNVLRDDFGIPHIYAQNERDLFFAQGYIHAQDRFWQMEFWRHIGQGRLSEIVGEPTVNSDKFIRTMGWHRMAQNTLDYYQQEAPDYYAILEAYAAGVNAYLAENGENISINQTILGLVGDPWEIEPWTPLNTVSWGIVMADDLGGNYSGEISRATLIAELGQETVNELLPPYPYDNRPVIVPSEWMSSAKMPAFPNPATQIDWSRVNLETVEPPAAGFAFGRGAGIGSNNWVVSGEHTASGKPLLANDPHLGIQMPSIWYEVGLHAPGWDVAGFSFAGVPGVIVGHNERIAWGVTNVGPDVQDLYIERINPDNPNQYQFMGEWREIETIQETIKVNGGEDVALEVRLTHHGPIINDVTAAEGDLLALRWTAQEPSRTLQAIVLLNQAQNYADFREALRFFDVPSQNVVYADVDGNIAYQTPGLIPIRKNGDGLTPVPGWTGEYEWEGWIPYEELPAVLNPEQGVIVTANHAVVDEQYPYLLSLNWSDGDRGKRINDMIGEIIAHRPITADDFAHIQNDSYSLLAESYAPLFDALSSPDGEVQAAIELLQGWEDYQLRRDSVPAALFEIFYMHLVELALADDVGGDQVGRSYSLIFFQQLAGQPTAAWWDDAGTPAVETRDELALQAIGETVAWFKENVGDDMDSWRWGDIHTATFVSVPVGQSDIAPIKSLVNRGPIAVDGGRSIVNANSWRWSDPAIVTGHPSMRMILELSDFDQSRAINPTGQSGHPMHPHYGDMIGLWATGEYHPLPFTQSAVESRMTDQLKLTPAQ